MSLQQQQMQFGNLQKVTVRRRLIFRSLQRCIRNARIVATFLRIARETREKRLRLQRKRCSVPQSSPLLLQKIQA